MLRPLIERAASKEEIRSDPLPRDIGCNQTGLEQRAE
jgi:hypothetical protein